MKTCPVCKAQAFDDAEVCYGCLHKFEPADAAEKAEGGVGGRGCDRSTPRFDAQAAGEDHLATAELDEPDGGDVRPCHAPASPSCVSKAACEPVSVRVPGLGDPSSFGAPTTVVIQLQLQPAVA